MSTYVKLINFNMQTLFSMSFFNFTPSSQGISASWVVSDQIWIYWGFAGPLTILTITLWYMREGFLEKVLALCRNWLQRLST